MQTTPTQPATGSFEFRFISVLANHADNQFGNVSDQDDLKALLDLGRDGWQIRGMTPDPRQPAATLILVLQRGIDR